jgi:hypothetical protein
MHTPCIGRFSPASSSETVDADQPAGVQQMEAITIVWTMKWLVIAYALSGFPQPMCIVQ